MRSRSRACRVLWVIAIALLTWPVSAEETAAPTKGDVIDSNHAEMRKQGLALFRSEIRSLLIEKCVSCHGGDVTESRLDISTHEGLLKGGERGPAVVIGRGAKSLLTQVVSHQLEPVMPKDGEQLSPSQIQVMRDWIDLGAPYDEPLLNVHQDPADWTRRTIATEAKDFWSFQPLGSIELPQANELFEWAKTPIDAFVLDRLTSNHLHPNPTATRAVLVRRLSFDLLGLPPSPSEIEHVVADPRPDAIERLIDSYLANPHYGERWGRRWLDLVRFAESHGFEHDYDRISAFHYRDFVIQALNEGMPYDRFISWQIAGDEFEPDNRQAMMATGYLAAGVHSTQITMNEVEKHRYDEMDDMLSTIGTSILGLTIGCARCHDHKFDAIPQADYYRLLSTFTKTVRSEVELDFDPEGYRKTRQEFDGQHVPYEADVRQYETDELPKRYQEWLVQQSSIPEQFPWIVPDELSIESDAKAIFTRQSDLSWMVTGPNPVSDVWTLSFNTNQGSIRSIRIEALADSSLNQSGPGRATNGNFALSDIQVSASSVAGTAQSIKLISAVATFEQNGFPVLASIDQDTQSAWAIDPEFGKDHAAIYGFAEAYGDGQRQQFRIRLSFNRNTGHTFGRFRVSISSMPHSVASVGNVIGESIFALISVPWDQLTDPQRALVLNWFKTSDAGWKRLDRSRNEHLASAPRPRIQKVLVASEGLPAVKLHTQAAAEFLEETHFLRRGEPNAKVAVAKQGFLQVLMANGSESESFLSVHDSGKRTSLMRASLANWLLDRQQGAGSLVARVIANRIWQHHLGRGIVSTPSDFGVRGQQPTHPELLEWLSQELIRCDWQLKPLHRQILASHVYQQSCDTDSDRVRLDRENLWYWHRPRRRLEAESIRDALLSVSGRLDDRLYGSGTLDESHVRRSIYFTIKRSQLIPSMAVFDSPDGTTPVADRPQTTVAPQALLLMNGAQARLAAIGFAKTLSAKASYDEIIIAAYVTCLGRSPTEFEMSESKRFLMNQSLTHSSSDPKVRLEHALADLCQVLFCLNEFIFVE